MTSDQDRRSRGAGSGWILILGSQRSGTTLLGQILGCHRHALLIDEPDGAHKCLSEFLEAGDATGRLFRKACREAQRKYNSPRDRVSLLGRLRPAIDRVVWKVPNHTFGHAAIARRLPMARCIFLHRDVRAVAASIAKHAHVLPRQTDLLRQAPAEVRRRFLPASRAIDSPGASDLERAALLATLKMSCFQNFVDVGLKTVRVRYEELVEEPKATVTALLEWLGMVQDMSCLNHGAHYRGLGPGATDRNRPIDCASLNRWRDEMTETEGMRLLELVRSRFETAGGLKA